MVILNTMPLFKCLRFSDILNQFYNTVKLCHKHFIEGLKTTADKSLILVSFFIFFFRFWAS